MDYREFKAKQEEEFNEFSKDNIIVILEFSKEEALAKLEAEGLTTKDIVNLGSGCYLKKEAIPEYNELVKRHDKEYHEYLLANVYDVVFYELANYETEISLSYSYNDVLTKIIGLTPEEIEANKDVIDKAIADYKEDFYKYN